MPWDTWVPTGTQANVRFGYRNLLSMELSGLRITGIVGFDLNSLNSPQLEGVLEVSGGQLQAVGGGTAGPEFPLVPGWRKVVRSIG